jgi:hypothetical protein
VDSLSAVAEASAVAEVPDRLVVRCGAFGAELARGSSELSDWSVRDCSLAELCWLLACRLAGLVVRGSGR